MQSDVTSDDLLRFWREAGPDRCFAADAPFDEACRERFGTAHEDAVSGRLDAWEETPNGALALVILLDQLSRNLFRGTGRAWASDAHARAVAERAVGRGFDMRADPDLRRFLYLPFEHAEDRTAQARSVSLHEQMGDEEALAWARHHRDIVDRFGRFPHRNVTLGRETTPEEAAFLETSDFRG